MSHDSPIRVLAVDDHPLFRQGIAALIEEVPDMVLAGRPPTAGKRSSSFASTARM
jgi:DNA-binding NarL/FixJ family response regulator